MNLQYLLDENLEPSYKTQLQRRNRHIIMWVVGEPGVHPKGTLDPEILCWCEEYNFVLVTNNRKSMPVHLTDHIAAGRHVPGIFIINLNLSRGEIIIAFPDSLSAGWGGFRKIWVVPEVFRRIRPYQNCVCGVRSRFMI